MRRGKNREFSRFAICGPAIAYESRIFTSQEETIMKNVIPCALLALFAGSLSAIAAAAQFSDQVPTQVVQFADLDVSSSEGATMLYRRIRGAARAVCESVDARTLEAKIPRHGCEDQAVERAVAQVHAPALDRYYNSRTGRTILVANDLATTSSP
jgi:UrcA family protein